MSRNVLGLGAHGELFLGEWASGRARRSPAMSRNVLGLGAPRELFLGDWASGRVRHSPAMPRNVLGLGSQGSFSWASGRVRHSPAMSRNVLGLGAPRKLFLGEWASRTLSHDVAKCFRVGGSHGAFLGPLPNRSDMASRVAPPGDAIPPSPVRQETRIHRHQDNARLTRIPTDFPPAGADSEASPLVQPKDPMPIPEFRYAPQVGRWTWPPYCGSAT